MNRIAGAAAESRGKAEHYPSVETLLREGSFYERLEKARALRAEALAHGEPEGEFVDDDAATATTPDQIASPQTLPAAHLHVTPKPAAPKAASADGHNLFVLNPARPFADDADDTLPVAKFFAVAETLPASPTAAAEPPVRRDTWRRWKVLVGFALGLTVGVAASILVPPLLAPTGPATTPATTRVLPATDAPGAMRLSGIDSAPTVPEPALAPSPATGAADFTAPVATDVAVWLEGSSARPPLLAPAMPILTPPGIEADALQPAAMSHPPRMVALPMSSSADQDPSDLALPAQPLPSSFTADPPKAKQTAVADVHVRLRLPAGTGKSEARALNSQLQKAGVSTVEKVTSDISYRVTEISYYHPTDFDAADQLANAIGATLRDASNDSQPPAPGTIDINYAAQPKVAKAKKTTPKSKRSTDQELAALRARILRQLQGVGN